MYRDVTNLNTHTHTHTHTHQKGDILRFQKNAHKIHRDTFTQRETHTTKLWSNATSGK